MVITPDNAPESLLPLSPQAFHILVALAGGEQHGYAIMQEVAARTGGKLQLNPGSMYGTVKRMLEQGLISELRRKERPADDDARRRYYRLTPLGRRVARAEAARLEASLAHARQYGLTPHRF
ncbi:MAG TPA: PadR family transcriptional regulator [Terriglobales bacterium]|nr:PadR family transcriptional regulator [Terriglobales bacterium]